MDAIDLPSSRRRSALVMVVRLVAVAAVVGFAVGNRATLALTWAGVGRMAVLPALVGVLLSVVAMANRGQLHRAAFAATGMTVPPRAMTRTAAVGFAANKVLKSAGASGLAVFIRDGRRRGLESGPIAAASLLAEMSSTAAFGVLLTCAVTILARKGRLVGWSAAAATGFGVYILGVVVAGVLVVRCRDQVRGTWVRLQSFGRRLHRRPVGMAQVSTIDAVYAAMAGARSRPNWTRRLLGYALASKALGVLTLLAGCHAAGVRLSVADAIVVYSAALAASFVSLIPAGLGVVEASVGAMLVNAGASVSAAALGVALFRIFDLWIPVVTGTALGHGGQRSASAAIRPASPSRPNEVAA